MKDLSYYANLSIQGKKQKQIECDVTLTVDGERWHAYEVSIASQDLLFFCDKGTLNYLVDNYGNQVFCELFNAERAS